MRTYTAYNWKMYYFSLTQVANIIILQCQTVQVKNISLEKQIWLLW